MHALMQCCARIQSENLALCGTMLLRQTTGPALAVTVDAGHIVYNLFQER